MLSASGQIAVVANAAASIFTLNFKSNIVGANGNAISSMSAFYMPCANQHREFIGNIFLMTNLTAMTSTVEMFILGSSTQGCVHPTFSANKFVRLVASPSSAGLPRLRLFLAIGIVINGNQFYYVRVE